MTIASVPHYRPDIDGLRSIAVLAVLFSHLRIGWLGGGYIGVDMFFVISGYVVFGDLLRRARNGEVSALDFYWRRIRRLLPNLVAMCALVLVVALVIFLPSDLVRLPARIGATLLGVSNWLYAYQSGYFLPASEWNPLLHTWTLSVELQFYLLVPLVVLAAARHGELRMRIVVVVLTGASLAYALQTRHAQSSWHFYDSAARAWEFLLGIALRVLPWPRLPAVLSALVCSLAVAVLGACFLLLTRDAEYPDARTLLPTLATAALIICLPHARAWHRVLASRPAVAVGKASYSIYIWHWPFVVFSAYLAPSLAEHVAFSLVLVPLIMLTAFAAYHHIEVPLRSPASVSDERFSRLVLAAGSALAAACAIIVASSGWSARFDDRVLRLDREEAHVSARRKECHRSALDKPIEKSCTFGAPTAPTIAVWSDSHGVELADTLGPALAARGRSAVLYSFSSCPPRKPLKPRTACEKFDRQVLAHLVQSPNIGTVILAGAIDSPQYPFDRFWPAEFTAAARDLQAAGKKLVIVYPVPRQPFHVPRAIATELRFSLPWQSALVSRHDYLERTRWVFDVYDRLGNRGIGRVYPDRVFCATGVCAAAEAGEPYYFDDNHLSLKGAKRVAEQTLLTLP